MQSENLPAATVGPATTGGPANAGGVVTKGGENLLSPLDSNQDHDQFMSFLVEGQLFGLPLLSVQDVIRPQQVTKVPLAPSEVAGSLNLRGRVVTVVDVRTRLGLAPRDEGKSRMNVVVEQDGELYSLIVDNVGEVLDLSKDVYESNPGTLDTRWREFANGVYRLDGQLMVLLDQDSLLDIQ